MVEIARTIITFTISQFLGYRFGGSGKGTACLFIDDIDKSFALEDMLNSYLVDEFERIEVFDRGVMVRLYSKRKLARMANNVPLPHILLMRIGLSSPTVCK